MENFYNRLKKKIKETPQQETDWDMWSDIESKLDKEDKRRFILPLWFWMPFGLLLGAGGMYFFMKSNGDVVDNTRIVSSLDTVYLSQSEIQTDTLYLEKEIIRWKYLDDNLLAKNEVLIAENALIKSKLDLVSTNLETYKSSIENSPFRLYSGFSSLPGISLQKSTALNPSNNKIDSSIELSNWLGLESLESINSLNNLSFRRKDPMVFIDRTQLNRPRTNTSLLDLVTPDYFNLGITLGNPALTINQENEVGYDMGLGLFVEALFSSKFSLRTGFQMRSNSTKITSIDRATTYPQPVGVPSELNFANLNIISSFIDIPLHAKLNINSSDKVNTYLLAGLHWSKLNGREYKYEYKTGGGEIYYEVKESSGSFFLGNYEFGLGLDYTIAKRWRIMSEPFIRYNATTLAAERDKSHALGIRLGLFYEM